MKRERLYFSGTRRRGAHSLGVWEEREQLDDQPPVLISRYAIISSDGQGQHYELNRPDSFWRSFGELDLSRRADSFVKRYGWPLDPPGDTSPKYETRLWLPFQLPLREAAQAWLPADTEGISHCDASRNELAARTLAKETPEAVWDETRLAPPDAADNFAEPQPRAQTLRSFMLLSALYDLRNANSMRQCALCSTWFTLRRVGALYCSQSCNVTGIRLKASVQALKKEAASECGRP